MKKIISLTILLFIGFAGKATHIAGGELFYEYLGAGSAANTSKYKITMRLFRECNPPPIANGFVAILDGERVEIGIYASSTLNLVNSIRLVQQFTGTPPQISNTPGINPCLTGNPNVCYQVGIYTSTIELSNTVDGYTLSWVRYTRTTTIQNANISTITGATFTTLIPGTNKLPVGNNSSPQFAVKDTTIVCRQTAFSIDYSAIDMDKDSLAYRFAAPYDGPVGGTSALAYPNPVPQNDLLNLQLQNLTFLSPYTALTPLGNAVTIDAKTGIISGTAPVSGRYVLCVVAEEWRNGVLINSHRKDFILIVSDCSISNAELQPSYLNCNDLTFTFTNLSSASNIVNYLWTFGEPTRGSLDSSTSPIAIHTYSDTGVYIAKLKVTSSTGCMDSTTTTVSVFPGFVTNFKVDGSCLINSYQFTDLTVSKYGLVNSWTWDFGETTVTTDTSTLRYPTYKYPLVGSKTVTLLVKDSKGCSSTLTQNISVSDKPSITLPFKDTLICSIDTLQLFASSSGGTYLWTSIATIINPNTANPFVTPKDTTVYYVLVNNNGCVNTDSITVNVLDSISVNAGLDTAICQTDVIQLQAISDGALSYAWSSSTNIAVPAVKNPIIQPLVNTAYYVTAYLGKCQAKDTVSVAVSPYPLVTASADTSICYGKKIQISASIVGDTFTWSPTSSMINSNTLTPTVGPIRTTDYIISVTNTTACLKTVKETIRVTVFPPVNVFAGRDISVVINQPLQLTATTNTDTLTTRFLWTPSTWLNSNTIYNPIATISSPIDSIKYKVSATSAEGCIGEDEILVHVFRNAPDILVPSGFTPNGDGKNDIIKAIPIGIKNFLYFNVYNRFGQLMYSSPEIGKGWDGIFAGTVQPAGTYVYSTQGVDYLGNIIFRKGTVVLIR
ncbi:MAG: PKD domain-containing protein [Flavobacterium sp.]|nr:PKD domain-containing protein [Flavobacterium sp.]